MSNTAIAIADEVVKTLNNIEDEDDRLFTAVRLLFPFYELNDLAELKVTVVPKSVDIQSFSRGASEFDCQIDIAFQKSVKSPDAPEVSTLADLVLNTAKSFRGKVYSDIGAACYKIGVLLYSAEHIQPPSVFTSVITLNFKIIE
jgi:hypothetical protein